MAAAPGRSLICLTLSQWRTEKSPSPKSGLVVRALLSGSRSYSEAICCLLDEIIRAAISCILGLVLRYVSQKLQSLKSRKQTRVDAYG